MSNRIELGHGLVLNLTRSGSSVIPTDVWIQFWGSDGKSAAISIAAEAERMGGVIGAGLRSWASDRINDYVASKIVDEEAAEARAADGQFGVGA